MDGFNVIPIESELKKDLGNLNLNKNATNSDIRGTSTIDENEAAQNNNEETTKTSLFSSILFLLGIVSFAGVIGYFIFIILSWQNTLSQIGEYSANLASQKDKIDQKELQDFIDLDKSLKAVKQRLGRHILNTEILKFMNSNLRSSITLTDYNIEAKDTTVELSFNSIASSFKDMAEQTERLFLLKQIGLVQSFSVANISLESDSKKLKFMIRVNFDRLKVSALELSKQMPNQNNVTPTAPSQTQS